MKRIRMFLRRLQSAAQVLGSDLYVVVSFKKDGTLLSGHLPDSMTEPFMDAVRDIHIDLDRDALKGGDDGCA